MYSPDGESLAGETGISAGSEGVAIHGKNTQRTPQTKLMACPYVHTLLNVHNNCIPVSDCVCEGCGGSCTGMRSLDGALEVWGRTASFVGVVSAIP